MPRKIRPEQNRKMEILLAARNLVFSEGATRLTMRRVGEAVDISEPAVYRHFKNKEDLLRALINFMFEGWEEKLVALKNESKQASVKLVKLGKIHLSHLIDHQFNPVLLLSEANIADQPTIKATLIDKSDRIAAVMTSILKEGINSGEFSDKLNIRSASLAIFGVLQGSLIRWTLSRSTKGLSSDLEGALKLIIKGFS